MPEQLQEFLAWYLAPWRRIGRKPFNIALFVATIPGLIFMVVGFGNSAGNFLEPLMNLTNISQPVGNMELEHDAADRSIGTEQLRQVGFAPQMTSPLDKLKKPAPTPVQQPVSRGWDIDWSGIFNSLCLLAMIPISRMRLRDMGYFGWQEVFLTVVFNVSVVEGLIQALSGWDISGYLPLGSLWGFINFMGYAWLSMAKGKAREAVHEKVPETWQPTDFTPAKKRFDDEY